MSFAIYNNQAFFFRGYYEFGTGDQLTLGCDLALIAAIAILCGLILSDIIPIDPASGIGEFIQGVAWGGAALSFVIAVLDSLAITMKRTYNSSPLHHAIANNDLSARQSLLATPNELEKRDHHGRTPLHLAVLENNQDILPDLLHAGADINAEDTSGMTPLTMALRDSEARLVLTMLEANREINLAISDSKRVTTPLHYAAIREGFTDIVDELLKRHASCDIRDPNGATPLNCAVDSTQPETVKKILEAGADVNLADDTGCTPLHHAVTAYLTYNQHCTLEVQENYKTVVVILLEHPKIQNISNNQGLTPYDIAERGTCSELRQLLSQKFTPDATRKGAHPKVIYLRKAMHFYDGFPWPLPI